MKANNVIVLAGQPNTGKSSIFNRLTGSNQHVGNWPGKTVEKKEGAFKFKGHLYQLVDLPGTYSLTANSAEEIITRDYIIKKHPDVLVVVVDASQLERTLYLAAETSMLPVKTIVALNMTDIAEREGRKICHEAMGKQMGVTVIPMVASKNIGFSELLEAIKESVENHDPDERPIQQEFEGEVLARLNEVKGLIKGLVPSPFTEDWMALKLMEDDREVREIMRKRLGPDQCLHLDKIINNGLALLVADSRYKWIQKIIDASETKSHDTKSLLDKRNKFDKVATHPVWGIFVALGILFFAIVAAMSIGSLGLPFLKIVSLASDGARILLGPGPEWLSSMMADGLIVGVGIATALSFFLMGVFIVVGFLEDVGYLPRLAYVFDLFMHGIGLHGKSFMPFLMGFCCNISGVLGTRVVDSWRQRLITVLLIPIIPCYGIWAVVSFIGTIFFGVKTPMVVLALLITAALHLALTSFLLRRFIVKGESTGLIMELPPYHKPNFKTIWTYAWTNEKGYLKRGFSIIAMASFIVWFFSYFPEGKIETSFLASTGSFLNPIGNLMGCDWKLMAALIVSVMAKESALPAIAILYGTGQGLSSITGLAAVTPGGEHTHNELASILMQSISPESALAFLFALTFSIPCSATISVLYTETRSLKWTAGASTYYTLSSLVAGILAYQAALLIF
jgi:ferrous iron transport protein B